MGTTMRTRRAAVAALMVLLAGCGSAATKATGVAEANAGATTTADSGSTTAAAGQSSGGTGSTSTSGASSAAGAANSGGNSSSPTAHNAKTEAAQSIDDMSEADPVTGRADTAPMVWAKTNEGKIEQARGADRWTFTAKAGEFIAIDVISIDHDCNFDLKMNLEGPDGKRGLVTWVGNNGCSAQGPIAIEADGNYVLEFASGDGSIIKDNIGGYRFAPFQLTEVDEAPATLGKPVDGQISEVFGVDRWTLDAKAGQVLTVDVRSIDNDCSMDLSLVVEDPLGKRGDPIWIGNNGCKAHDPIKLAKAGQYVIEIYGGSGSVIKDNTGAYSFVATLS